MSFKVGDKAIYQDSKDSLAVPVVIIEVDFQRVLPSDAIFPFITGERKKGYCLVKLINDPFANVWYFVAKLDKLRVPKPMEEVLYFD